MKYYIVFNRKNNGIDILDTFLGCYSKVPIHEKVQISDDAESQIITKEFEGTITDYVYIKCKFCNSMGFNSIVFTEAYSDLSEALNVCVNGRKGSNDTIFRIKVDSDLKPERAFLKDKQVTGWY